MTQPHQPLLPIPAPLRGSEKPSFTNYSIEVRLPDIARRTIAENQFSDPVQEAIESLAAGIPGSPIRPLDIPLAPDAAAWESYLAPYLGQNWLDVPWFFAEAYFYARILEATGYFCPGPGQAVDPYAHQKRMGLETSRAGIRQLGADLTAHLSEPGASPARLLHFLRLDLTGNQGDLSLWPAKPGQAASTGRESGLPEGHILVDDLEEIAAYLAGLEPYTAQVDLVLDNAGFELVCDLALADVLLATGQARRVQLHLKAQPAFVSDALIPDVHAAIAFIGDGNGVDCQAFAGRLQRFLEDGRLVLADHSFWTTPLPQWEMPDDLYAHLAESQLAVFKGDAHYRRLLGDRHWDFTTPLGPILAYMPAPTAALRTLKSEIVVGLQPGQAERASQADPKWMIDGQWAVAQLVRAAGAS